LGFLEFVLFDGLLGVVWGGCVGGFGGCFGVVWGVGFGFVGGWFRAFFGCFLGALHSLPLESEEFGKVPLGLRKGGPHLKNVLEGGKSRNLQSEGLSQKRRRQILKKKDEKFLGTPTGNTVNSRRWANFTLPIGSSFDRAGGGKRLGTKGG